MLRGAAKGDLYDVCVALAAEMTMLFAGVSRAEAESRVVGAIESGAAFQKMQEWVAAQGGDSAWLTRAQYGDGAALAVPVVAPADGYLTNMDAEAIGGAAVILGAGRSKKEDMIDYSAGILVGKKTGDAVKKGQVLATLYTNDAAAIEPATQRYLGALTIACGKRNPKAEMVGCDIWSGAYKTVFSKKICEQNAEAEGVANVSFQEGNALRLPFENESFDAVTSNYVYHNIAGKDKKKLLLETLRVLKKGGTFAIHDLMSPARYGDMDAFVRKLKEQGYEDVRLIDTTDGMFMGKKEAAWLGLGGSTLLVGRK